jgi:multidrug efflux pump subunit AcrA (membrane-fusion protein)
VTRRLLWPLGTLAALAAIAAGGFHLSRESIALSGATASSLPVTAVKRGDVRFSVIAKGQLQGGNSDRLLAPMAGTNDLIITELREPGELVNVGDSIVQFDTTEQEFELREAKADLTEAEQQIRKAKAETEARRRETQLALAQAEADVTLARIECRKNPLVAAITARQNELALQSAEDQLRQLREDLTNQQATSEASIAIQEAARSKAMVRAETAQRNIDAMTLRAKRSGYVALEQNSNLNMMYFGMPLPAFKVGDTVRAGMLVAQIPDLESWEISARIGELDRGHLKVGQDVEVRVIAVPDKPVRGRITSIGGTTGPPWERSFECKIALRETADGLRQGMTVELQVFTGELKDVLWIPSQALFENDGRTFVYRQQDGSFQPVDVKLVRRSESQAVIEGVPEHTVLALASPDQIKQETRKEGGVMNALPTR